MNHLLNHHWGPATPRRGLRSVGRVTGMALGLCSILVAWGLASGCARVAPAVVARRPVLGWLDLEGRPQPISECFGERGLVMVYLSVDCPIANRCLPEVEDLARRLGPRGMRFVWVYPQAQESREDILRHRAEYGLKVDAFRDDDCSVARAFQVHHTPEAVVLDRQGRLIYRGRINDQFQKLGVSRPAPTQHDLAEALEAWLAGKPLLARETAAVGCRFRE